MRFTLLVFVCFGLHILNFKDVEVNGAITLLRRQNSEEINIKENTREIPQSDEEEPGFELDDEDTRKFHMWPNGIIPYYIDDFSFDKVIRDTIRVFLNQMSHMTNLKFLEQPRPPTDDSRWVFFINRQGLLRCADHSFESFTNEGVQKVVFGYDCINNDYGVNEVLLMLVGVPPQHNAPDRDKFIEINMNNIMPSKKHLFKKLKDDEWLFHDLEYDYNSAGHYDSHKFTFNGGATIIPKQEGTSNIQIGYKKQLSYLDIKKVRMLYNFISEKKTSLGFPECNKMFSRGSNLTKYNKNTETQRKPRHKPNKYLGLPDVTPQMEEEIIETHNEEPTIDKSENEEEEELNDIPEGEIKSKEIKENYKESTSDIPIKEDEENHQAEEESKNHSNEDVRKRSTASAYQTVALKGNKKEKGQFLLDLSDFATGEN